jgi:hypothetical protein
MEVNLKKRHMKVYGKLVNVKVKVQLLGLMEAFSLAYGNVICALMVKCVSKMEISIKVHS